MVELFLIWILLNSCVFMMAYFLLFLLLKYSYKKSILICIISTVWIVGIEIFRIQYAFHIIWARLVFTILQIVIIQSTALLLAERKDSYTFFIGLSSSNFTLGGTILSYGAVMLLKNYIAAMIICTLTNLLVLLWITCTIQKICKEEISKENLWWFCLVPCMCYVTFYLLLYFPVSFERHPENIFVAMVLLLTVVFLYVLIMKYIYAKLEEKRLIWKNVALHAYVKGIAVQSENVEAAKRELQIMRHDMRHKDSLLIELIHSHKYKEAEGILYHDIEHLSQKQVVTYCDNVIINSVLCSMEQKAKGMKIVLHIKSAIPEQQKIDDYELAMLIANLIENALYAVQKLKEEERIVEFMMKNRTGDCFLLEVKNLCDKQVKFSKESGLPISEQGAGHGFGMISVQEFVKKYQAEFDCYVEEREFVVRILIHL